MIDFTCGECNTAMRADEDDGGKKTLCPECGARTEIPKAHNRVVIRLRGVLAQSLFAFGIIQIMAVVVSIILSPQSGVLAFGRWLSAFCLGLLLIATAYVITYLRYLANKIAE